jgi:hypothetical protein
MKQGLRGMTPINESGVWTINCRLNAAGGEPVGQLQTKCSRGGAGGSIDILIVSARHGPQPYT